TMRIPGVKLGEFQLPRITAVSRPTGTFEKGMSPMMTGPIIGAIGGNVLKAFRVEIDYANGATYLEKRGDPDNALDLVALTLSGKGDGTPVCSGVSKENATRAIQSLEACDKHIRGDKLEAHGKALPAGVNSENAGPS